MKKEKTPKVGILIVNGGKDPQPGRWIELCLHGIRTFTTWSRYHIYIWNNNFYDVELQDIFRGQSNITMIDARPSTQLGHIHAGPLQELYEIARGDDCDYILTMDSDAQPLRSGWLTFLISKLSGKTVIAGVWRDELAAGIKPYAHPSCLCTTTAFIEKHHLRFDFISRCDTGQKSDTLSHFTETALESGHEIFKLKRSNRNNFHRLIGGIYGDLIYHHGAGTRINIGFHDEGDRIPKIIPNENRRLRDISANLVFSCPQEYYRWLKRIPFGGDCVVENFLILGMHRSGTSCLAGSLERCGLYLGQVSRTNEYNLKGNHENRNIVALHNHILNENNGAWDEPPENIHLNAEHQAKIADAIKKIKPHKPWGVKDPRLLLLANHWFSLCNMDRTQIVGSFRHPSAVAKSLFKRNRMSTEDALSLWRRYNEELIELHKKYQFPLIEFDLVDVDGYCKKIAALAVSTGLYPRIDEIRSYVDKRLEHHHYNHSILNDQCMAIYSYLKDNAFEPSAQELYLQENINDLLRIGSNLADVFDLQKINQRLRNQLAASDGRLNGIIDSFAWKALAPVRAIYNRLCGIR